MAKLGRIPEIQKTFEYTQRNVLNKCGNLQQAVLLKRFGRETFVKTIAMDNFGVTNGSLGKLEKEMKI